MGLSLSGVKGDLILCAFLYIHGVEIGTAFPQVRTPRVSPANTQLGDNQEVPPSLNATYCPFVISMTQYRGDFSTVGLGGGANLKLTQSLPWSVLAGTWA